MPDTDGVTEPPPYVVLERNFVMDMQRLREARRMTQTDLAKAMKRYGLSFHQQTIQRIESGERPVRLSEAILIAQELGSSIAAMIADSPSLDQKIAQAQIRLVHATAQRDEATEIVEHTTRELMWLHSMAKVVTQREVLEAEAKGLRAQIHHTEGEIDSLTAMINDEQDDAAREDLRRHRKMRSADLMNLRKHEENMRVDLDNLRQIGI